MCLAVPGKIVEIRGDDPVSRTGRVDFGGIVREVSLAYVPEARLGDYVIVHVGFALNILDQEEAAAVLSLFEETSASGTSGNSAQED